ncbi:SSI family serine proteinase inhibitor [Actinotalea sp. C106]|uniref:SSI family serine proteinase inhibitor n=1 Tax=Actinotalea sp. C106 TaxID=2908644 RepID=UPI0020284C21|nr:SSI family serine proteinase inhibitor [Actinotalea sp. C106]
MERRTPVHGHQDRSGGGPLARRPPRTTTYGLVTGSLLLALTLLGCGGPAEPDAAPGSTGAGSREPTAPLPTQGTVTVPPPSTSLSVTVDATGDGAARTYSLACDPAVGDHPDPEAACALLEEVGTEAFAPVPRDASCTQQYGGPQTATVEGTLDGDPVDARFAYTDGCEILRWDALGDLLPADAGLL